MTSRDREWQPSLQRWTSVANRVDNTRRVFAQSQEANDHAEYSVFEEVEQKKNQEEANHAMTKVLILVSASRQKSVGKYRSN